jgi:hypothetical protein
MLFFLQYRATKKKKEGGTQEGKKRKKKEEKEGRKTKRKGIERKNRIVSRMFLPEKYVIFSNNQPIRKI